MAIFVSTPTSAAPAAPSLEAIDPAVIASVPGFTEELAAAMQPLGLVIDASAKAGREKPEVQDQSPSDLQILPAEVLINAVGDANFALGAQAGSATKASLSPQITPPKTEPAEDPVQDPVVVEMNNMQGAELAAANLAAQMATAPVTPSNPLAPEAVQALDVTATTAIAERASGLSTGSNLAQNPNQEPVSTSMAGATSIDTQASKLAMPDTAQATLDASKPTDPVTNIATSLQSLVDSSQTVLSTTAEVNRHITAPVEVGTKSTGEQKPVAVNTAVAEVTTSPESVTTTAEVTKPSPATAPETTHVNANANAHAHASTPASTPTVTGNAGVSVSLATSPPSSVTTTLAESVQANSSLTQKPSADFDAKVEGTPSVAEETAFNFDAKISKESPAIPKVVANVANNATTATPPSAEKPVSPSHLTPSPLQTTKTNEVIATPGLAQAPVSRKAILEKTTTDAIPTSGPVQAPVSREAVLEKTADSTLPVQTEFQSPATQSLEDLSSSFVSSLVGGPQRPVNTVMDWISLQAQERPAPVVPHEVRLDAGAVQLEIQKMVKQGGGHVVMELTPPDQSKFTIELKLDEQGGALLIVEGISDSTRTRLEQSAPQLREQFQQMGLELQLDMRQQGQSASPGTYAFSNSQEREPGGRDSAHQDASESPKMLTPREAGANRARETGTHQVYLYA